MMRTSENKKAAQRALERNGVYMKKQLALLMAATLTVAALAGRSSNGGGTNGTEGNTETKSAEAEATDKGDEARTDGSTNE